MLTSDKQRYRPTYRQDEVQLVCEYALRGESLCFVGIAGTGKSNLIKFLCDHQHEIPLLRGNSQRVHFCVVDATTWKRTPIHLWQLMLEALWWTTKDTSPQPDESNIVAFSEEERVLSKLRTRLRWICQERQHQVMFVLDDFDVAFEEGPLPMLEQLNSFRGQGNRGLLSYLIFTKKLPHVLGRQKQLVSKSKFFDLFRPSHFALEPYEFEDSHQMLRSLNDKAGKPLSARDLLSIQALTGGHARLNKVVFTIWAQEKPPSTEGQVGYFVAKSDVQQECRRILEGLHRQEQEAALVVVRRTHYSLEHAATIDHLFRRGMLVKLDPPTWFSPLMASFLSTYGVTGDV